MTTPERVDVVALRAMCEASADLGGWVAPTVLALLDELETLRATVARVAAAVEDIPEECAVGHAVRDALGTP